MSAPATSEKTSSTATRTSASFGPRRTLGTSSSSSQPASTPTSAATNVSQYGDRPARSSARQRPDVGRDRLDVALGVDRARRRAQQIGHRRARGARDEQPPAARPRRVGPVDLALGDELARRGAALRALDLEHAVALERADDPRDRRALRRRARPARRAARAHGRRPAAATPAAPDDREHDDDATDPHHRRPTPRRHVDPGQPTPPLGAASRQIRTGSPRAPSTLLRADDLRRHHAG